MDVLTAAAGIVRVSCEQMGDLIRRRTIQRRHDPSEFMLIAYGGAGPQFAGRFAAGLGVSGVILPALAAGLSAFGALSSDLRVRLERDLRPAPLADAANAVSEMFRELEPEARGQLAAAGHANQVLVRRLVSIRYYRQIHRMDLTVPGPLDAAATERLAEAFRARYESVVGAGSAPPGTPVEVVAVSVEATLPTHITAAAARSPSPPTPPGTSERCSTAPRSPALSTPGSPWGRARSSPGRRSWRQPPRPPWSTPASMSLSRTPATFC